MSRYTPSASQVVISLLGNMLHETQVVVSAVSCAGICESSLHSVCCAKQRFKSTVASYACTYFLCVCVCSSRQLALVNIEMLSCVVQVHRGVYVAAEILYERFKPMVEEQLASSPFAKIAFTVSHSQSSKLASIILQDKTVFNLMQQPQASGKWCTSLCVHFGLHYNVCSTSPHAVTVLLEFISSWP